ncbi:ribosomal protein [Marinitoga sp. 1197]|uniref:ribosomal-processing cysteine protease Prp n=1 Tax=unclassified Marinitoga TaxID=2640159 RepID=UPI000657FB9A|nr:MULTISPECIES: ribosomal-processing cysteine protease Prp [unclassified Marinitoga]KLO21814.1 ribosomal protein [Marinitoga sp. 1197]KLO22912.1 ribosomal protein [Marinitoga sp. 1155]
MINIIFNLKKNYVEIDGHADFDEYGKDILCSAVSTLTQFVAEIIKNEKIGNYKKRDGYLKIKWKNNELSDKLVKYLHDALKSLEESYPYNLKVEVNK